MKRWLAVTLHVPKELGEAVSNFLIELGSTGVEEVEENLKWEKLKAYFPQKGKERTVLRTLRRYLKSLQKMMPGKDSIQIGSASIPEQDWGERWRRFFKPVRVTERLMVKPPWSAVRPKKDWVVIDIHPGMAFGTGTHATTKLSLRALEARLKRKALSVLDVGTGSGILSIAAARLGAREVWGLDMDGAAVENARENVRLNDVSRVVVIRKGSIGDLQKRFDVVVANIDYKSLRRMRMALLSHLKPDGVLILSGILKRDEGRLCQHYMETGHLRRPKITQEAEWVCLTFKKGEEYSGKG